MRTVGVRDLKARLSEHLRRARAGEQLVITDRGKPVAILGPAAAPEKPAWLLRLVAEGKASWNGGRPDVTARPRVKLRRGASAAAIVIEDRR